MDIEEIKKLDKRVIEIQNPLGSGFPALRRVFEETALKNRRPVADIVRHYLIWKWRK